MRTKRANVTPSPSADENARKRIPVAAPDLSQRERDNALSAIESTWISSTGPFVDRFEAEFATLCETSTAISVCNGTAALHLALLALDVQAHDEVLVPSMTYISAANAVRYVGAEPIFVDSDASTWCIDPAGLDEAITARTVGIIAVHLYGHPADMDAIHAVAAAHGLWVVEDAAEAHFAQYRGRMVGSLARVATFSFYGNKMFTCGEGGAITLSDPELAARLRILRGQGMDPGRRYFFPMVGYNYRLTNVACAILCAQLERRQAMVAARRAVYDRYDARLLEVQGISPQPKADWAEVAPWLYPVTVDASEFGMSRDALAEALALQRIETRPFFIPLHTLPPYSRESRHRGDRLPVAELLGETGLSLPTSSIMHAEDVDRVCDAVIHARSAR